MFHGKVSSTVTGGVCVLPCSCVERLNCRRIRNLQCLIAGATESLGRGREGGVRVGRLGGICMCPRIVYVHARICCALQFCWTVAGRRISIYRLDLGRLANWLIQVFGSKLPRFPGVSLFVFQVCLRRREAAGQHLRTLPQSKTPQPPTRAWA